MSLVSSREIKAILSHFGAGLMWIEIRCFVQGDTAQQATGKDVRNLEPAFVGRHTFGVGCRYHGKAPDAEED